jgi:hypothetical protein
MADEFLVFKNDAFFQDFVITDANHFLFCMYVTLKVWSPLFHEVPSYATEQQTNPG